MAKPSRRQTSGKSIALILALLLLALASVQGRAFRGRGSAGFLGFRRKLGGRLIGLRRLFFSRTDPAGAKLAGVSRCRGGANVNDEEGTGKSSEDDEEEIGEEKESDDSNTEGGNDTTESAPQANQGQRHSSYMLEDLISRSAVVIPESLALRRLISRRSEDYLNELKGKSNEQKSASNSGRVKLPHPKKVLYYLAAKIPAIKHSPDVTLKIQTASSDIDSGVAACLIGTLARLCEVYDREMLSYCRQQEIEESLSSSKKRSKRRLSDPSSAASDLIKDRRFEQVVECLLCGVNVEQRKRQYLSQFLDTKRDDEDAEAPDDVEGIVEGDQVHVREGLNIRDACRASWGLAILGAHHCGTLGGTKVMDLLMALSLRIRDLLLSRLQTFLRGDLMEDLMLTDDPRKKTQSLEQRVDELAEEKAEDAAAAMWTFACVRACTGMRSDPLFETCCSILCQDPVDLRKRVQEANEETSINSVVDRLAKSQAEIEEEDDDTQDISANKTLTVAGDSRLKEAPKRRTGEEYKEALIDWLSPNELTDVLWALALHGQTDVNVRDETILSENAGALKDIAFDRLLNFLRKDFALAQAQEVLIQAELEAEVELHSSTEEVITKEGETMVVEVVDAAALLASEQAAKNGLAASLNMTEDATSTAGGLMNKVEVSNKITVLQSSSGRPDEHEVLVSEQELSIDERDPQTENLPNTIATEGGSAFTTLADGQTTVENDTTSFEGSIEAQTFYFSPHDLCSLAWAVTELRDSLRFETVDLVVNIFSTLGEESFDSLSGADLSNLAWAVARHSNDARPWSSDRENPACLQLTLWVVRRALIASGGNYNHPESPQNIHVLDPFQPPELSRLMWAVASLLRTHSDMEYHQKHPEIQELAIGALISAASNLSIFSPEDLIRILWAFLEVCDMDEALAQYGVADALGRVFSTVETAIVRWERGNLVQNVEEDEEEDTENRGGFNALTALFLRPSLSRQMLDQLIEEYHDLEEEEEKLLSTIVDKKKKKLPRLRDLGIDPSTLAKAAGAFARITSNHLNLRGSPILTRVTLKLLTSKNGRLLQEFSMCNLIRACEAAAINEAVGRGEDLVVGQFARRFLHLLNEANNSFPSHDSTSKTELRLSSTSPDEIATLLWSLGELGARHHTTDANRETAHRKLRLVMEAPLMTDDQIAHLSRASMLKALRGLVTLNSMQSDPKTLLKVLKLIEPKIQWMRDELVLCDLAESLAVIRQILAKEGMDLHHKMKNATLDSNEEIQNFSDNTTRATLNETSTSLDANTTVPRNNSKTDHELLDEASSRMLSAVANLTSKRVTNLRAKSLCRLLVVYSLLPFQADNLIEACEKEVARRQALLESAANTASVEDLLRQAAQTSAEATRTVFGKSEENNSPIETLRKSLKSLFSKEETEGEEGGISEEMQKFTNEVGSLLNCVTAAVTEVDECMEQIGTASNVHTDTALQRIMEAANFELGRCSELIENYRRIEFSTGRGRSRYDYRQRRDLGKRLLSRLLPR